MKNLCLETVIVTLLQIVLIKTNNLDLIMCVFFGMRRTGAVYEFKINPEPKSSARILREGSVKKWKALKDEGVGKFHQTF